MTSRVLPPPLQSPSRAPAGPDPFFELHREMNRLFDDFLGAGAMAGPSPLMAAPRLEVREDPHELRLCAELPGVRPEDVDLRVEGNLLTLRGEKRQETQRQQEDCHLMERSYGRRPCLSRACRAPPAAAGGPCRPAAPHRPGQTHGRPARWRGGSWGWSARPHAPLPT